MLDSLNNREIATYVWFALIIILCLISPSIRKSFVNVLVLLFGKKILTSVLSMALYVTLVVVLLRYFDFWDKSLLKDTIVWLFGVGFISIMNSNKAIKDEGHFKGIIIDTIKLTIIVDFIVNLYVFNFWIELIFLPFVTLLVLMQLVSQTEEKYSSVLKLVNTLLSIVGLVLIAYSVYMCITDFQKFASIQNLKNFLLPVILTFAFLPFLYFLVLYMCYEIYFIRIDMAFRHNEFLRKYSKAQVFKRANIRLNVLKKVSKELQLFNINSKEEFDSSLTSILFL